MRDVPIDEVDALDRDVVAIGTTYPPSTQLPAHRHRRAQFLYGVTGSMRVETADGSWTVPPHRAVLIPPGTEHAVLMDGVSTRSLYLEPRAVPWFPPRCRVVEVPALLRELVCEAVDVEPRYATHGRDAALLALVLHEIRRSAPLPLDLPLPADPALRALCREFLARPRIDARPEAWAAGLHVSVRTLHRRFTAETGTGLASWRRRACALHALPELAAGRPVTEIAADLGYAGPGAFTTMFTQLLGAPPSAFRDPATRTGGSAQPSPAATNASFADSPSSRPVATRARTWSA
ncbi:helix-turn-helix transcriptional regulator [Pseudonocardia sp. RS11V-5]|uniref:AraC family transcriptional regulator n=1 Tax=Pseudonocardia terrae TaxID=2905831 RepID=UPI001E535CF2|nr:helix-turn-helix transcriptional regulator [Pseudonocardia terrae]MCE3550204.1 helix-turn-helix transcriptional regulator [Pseudonocardia terrae]